MKMRRILSFLVILVALTAPLFAAGGAESGKPTIGFANYHSGVNPYASTYTDTFLGLLEEHSDEYDSIVFDAQGDPAEQASQLDTLISRGVDVIVLWPTDQTALVPAVQRAHQEGIPVLVTNSPLDKSANEYIVGFSGPNNVEEGQLAAELMIEAIGNTGTVVEIMGAAGYATTNERSEGFNTYIEENSKINVVERNPAGWDRETATQLMENYLVKYGDEIDGVYSADCGMGIGAMYAALEAGYDDIAFTDATLFGECWDAIQEGDYYGSVYQSPAEDARLAFETAVKILEGGDVEFYNYMETPKVDADNVTQYDRPPF